MTTMQLFSPIPSMKPAKAGDAGDSLYAKIMRSHKRRTFAEIKEDGYRFQIHSDGSSIQTFSRHNNEFNLALCPEIAPSLQRLPRCILDAEITGTQPGILGFKSVEARLNRNLPVQKALEQLMDEHPLVVRVFDVLHWEGNDLLQLPLEERRAYTEKVVEERITPSTLTALTSAEDIKGRFEELEIAGYEGLVCKNPQSLYHPGSSRLDWIKVKRKETLDLAVLGVYVSEGKATNVLGATYNDNTGLFEPLGKIGASTAGMGEQVLTEYAERFIPEQPDGALFKEKMVKRKIPDLYLHPEDAPLIEVAVESLTTGVNSYTCGLDSETGRSYSMRHATFKRFRPDKGPLQATTSAEIARMYERQCRVSA